MVKFRLEPNGIIYLYHWVTSKQPIKLSTSLKIDVKDWDKSKMRPKSSRFKYKGKNLTAELARIEVIYYKAWSYFQENGGFTPLKLKQKFRSLFSENSISKGDKSTRFLDFFESTLDEYKISKKRNSWIGYNACLNHLKSFFGREIPNFDDIDSNFFISYNNFLVNEGLSVNSISNNWKYIKAVMRLAHSKKLHSNDDYQFFKRKNEKADTIFLDENELDAIFKLNLSGYKDKARDYFLIGCYTGLRYDDWHLLNSSVIKNGIASIINSKTGDRSTFPIANNVMRILGKYPDGILPKKPSNQKLNKYIKEVAKDAGINDIISKRITLGGKLTIISKPKYEWISTHTARRSFATINVLNGVGPHLVMIMTGHKTLASFERYIRFDEIQASIELKKSPKFKKSFGSAFTWNEKMKFDPDFRNKQKKLLL